MAGGGGGMVRGGGVVRGGVSGVGHGVKEHKLMQ